MAGSALAEARERFGTYAQQLDQLQERCLERIGVEEIAALSTMLRAADQLLAAAARYRAMTGQLLSPLLRTL